MPRPTHENSYLSSFTQIEELRNMVAEGKYQEVSASLMPFFTGTLAEKRSFARETIAKLTLEKDRNLPVSLAEQCAFALSCDVSTQSLRNYATLDDVHVHEIDEMVNSMRNYIDDKTLKRPQNFLMLATPGAGKSHFIGCVAKRLEEYNVRPSVFNMTGMTTRNDLTRPLDDVRNAKVEDCIPLPFLDEFDADPQNYGTLLPLLWDGALNLLSRELRLGKLIIVMAGSSPMLPEVLEHAKTMNQNITLPPGCNPKIVDLLSRINGSIIKIPPFYDKANDIDRRADKVAIAAQLLRVRFGGELTFVPIGLLRLIARLNFRYDVRSIAHLINSIPHPKREPLKVIRWSELNLNLETPEKVRSSSLVYHLVENESRAHGVASHWHECSKDEALVPLPHSSLGLPVPSGDLDLSIALYVSQVEEQLRLVQSTIV